MKKLALFALLGLFAVSCSDDDPTIIEQDIVGSWEAQEIQNFQYPSDMFKYIRFDGSSYYSSNTETTPSSNAKSYTISFSSELKSYVLKVSGDDKEYRIALPTYEDLDLSYIVTPADTINGIDEVRQSLPYKRIQTQNQINPVP